MKRLEFSLVEAALFLKILWACATHPGYVQLSRTPAGRKIPWTSLSWHEGSTEEGRDGMVKELSRLNPPGNNVFVTINPRMKRLGGKARGGNKDIKELVVLVFELDIGGPHCPASEEEALAFLNALPLRPSMVVRSGHGLHVYYILSTPLQRPGHEEVALGAVTLEAVTSRFGSAVCALADPHGWEPHPVFDLARSMRLPGTYNLKYPADPVPVTLLRPSGGEDPIYYPLETITDKLLSTVPPAPFPSLDGPASGKYVYDPSRCRTDWSSVKSRCAVARMCEEHADSLSEPQWKFGTVGLALYCRDGEKIVHALSRPHPGYSEEETAFKIACQIKADVKPTKCEKLSTLPGFACLCDKCPHRGKLRTPLSRCIARA